MSLRLFGLWVMGEKGINMKIIAFLMIGIFLTVGSEGDGADQNGGLN